MVDILFKGTKKQYYCEYEKIKNDGCIIDNIKYCVEKFKFKNENNYLSNFFYELYKEKKRKQLKLLSDDIFQYFEKLFLYHAIHEITSIFDKYEIPIYLYSVNGLIYSQPKNKYKMKKINLFFSGVYIYFVNTDKIIEFDNNNNFSTTYTINFMVKYLKNGDDKKDDDEIKKNIKKKINGYKEQDKIIKNKYSNENINFKTINFDEAYKFIKEKNINNCPFCDDIILYCNYSPHCLCQFSFDRINNKEIHHINNLQIICYNCNSLKSYRDKPKNIKKNFSCINKCHIIN